MNHEPTTAQDDVEGHMPRLTGGRLSDADPTDEVERRAVTGGSEVAQTYRPTHPKAVDSDDVSGHLSGALGSKKKTEHDS
jgi:hypothetical protein